jgi:hypothetical protein
MEFALFFLAVILLDLAAWRWGVDSRDTQHSSDWTLRVPAHRA